MRDRHFTRRIAPTVLASCLLMPAAAQERPAPRVAAAESWFDPTQLPSFTGTVERYLVNPRGEVEALLFREGPQVVFPPDLADGLRHAVPPGRPVMVWGIRARHAPVITMLAYAPNAETPPGVVDRFYWRLGSRAAPVEAERMRAQGVVKAPYYAPQGEIAGAILEDGTVITVPPGTAEPLRDLLRSGARLAAEGRGIVRDIGRGIAADTIGDSAESLRPIPPPAETRPR
jgi:hypothetical protein